MIESIKEYFRLLDSEVPQDYHRITKDIIAEDVCLEIIKKFPKYRQWIADNHFISLRILKILADDKNSKVRWRVAQRSNLDYELFDKLSKDDDESIRHRIAVNSLTPLDILERLTHDEWERCARDAREIYEERLKEQAVEGPQED